MNDLTVVVIPERGVDRLHWVVDGTDLVDRLRKDIPPEIILQIREHRASLPPEMRRRLRPERSDRDPDFLGVAVRRPVGRDGLSWVDGCFGEPGPAALLAVCSCGEWGCSAVIADVRRADGVVSWLNVRPRTAANHPARRLKEPGVPDLHFDEIAYDQAFEHRQAQ